MTIRLKKYCDEAIFEVDGLWLREKILNEYSNRENKEENIIVDFSEISLFSAVFFESCFSFLEINYPKVFSKVKIQNLSKVGKKYLDIVLGKKGEILFKDISSEIFGQMRYLSGEENAKKLNMYREKSTHITDLNFFHN